MVRVTVPPAHAYLKNFVTRERGLSALIANRLHIGNGAFESVIFIWKIAPPRCAIRSLSIILRLFFDSSCFSWNTLLIFYLDITKQCCWPFPKDYLPSTFCTSLRARNFLHPKSVSIDRNRQHLLRYHELEPPQAPRHAIDVLQYAGESFDTKKLCQVRWLYWSDVRLLRKRSELLAIVFAEAIETASVGR